MHEGSAGVNFDLIAHRAQDIRSAAATLFAIGNRSREEFLADQIVVDAAKYRLVVAAEAAISICTHLAVRVAQQAPSSYSQCFDVLASAGILSTELAQRMSSMARFRDLLVHGYADIDDGRVWETLQGDLQDLDAYLSEVSQALGEQCL